MLKKEYLLRTLNLILSFVTFAILFYIDKRFSMETKESFILWIVVLFIAIFRLLRYHKTKHKVIKTLINDIFIFWWIFTIKGILMFLFTGGQGFNRIQFFISLFAMIPVIFISIKKVSIETF